MAQQPRLADSPFAPHVPVPNKESLIWFPRLRRPSPAMLVALLALVLATTGTAAAAVLISSPDQLGADVVTNPKIATDAVTAR